MPSDDSAVSYSQITGYNGQRIYNQTHDDIDISDIDITCLAGSIRIVIHERIWSNWTKRNEWTLSAGNVLNTSVIVDSGSYDGDHRLRVWATANGTSCTVNFESTDW
jgi:hypothetical protein